MMTATDPKRADGTPKWSLAGAVAAAAGASACCIGPLLLAALGIGGAGVGNLAAVERYRPYWIVATLLLLGLAFLRVYRKPEDPACAPGGPCPSDAGRRKKIILWIATALALGLLALPYLISNAIGGVLGGVR